MTRSGRRWLATTNLREFYIWADTFAQAAEKFQEKMGFYPESFNLQENEEKN